MALHLHRARRSDALVAGAAHVLAVPLEDPMATEVLAVPAQGIERWLSQRLSHHLGATRGGAGVSANIDFRSPGSLTDRVLAKVGGTDPETDPWRADRLIWPLLATIDASMGEPWCAALTDHLGAAADRAAVDDQRRQLRRARRTAVALRIAGLFDGYLRHRPVMVQQWLANAAAAAGVADTDGVGAALAPQRQWQPELFRRLRARIGLACPAERLATVTGRLRDDPAVIDLPSRLSVFGATRLSAQELSVLDALAAHREVHLWLPHPSPGSWSRVQELLTADPELSRCALLRRDDPTAATADHPLLRSLGRDSRELQLRLAGLQSTIVDEQLADITAPTGILGALQQDLADDRRPGELPAQVLAEDDRSIQVHACHGRARQVEVLREILVGLLADDPTLEPRDILVMCPDIEVYAPYVLAAFGAPGGQRQQDEQLPATAHPGTAIRVRLADRAIRRTNPVLDVLARLLELASSRMPASAVLDFAALKPVRARFGFDDDALVRLRDWTVGSGIRWGLNERGRAAAGLDHLRQNTWRTGVDRVLLGVAMSEDEPNYLGLALPLDDVDSGAIDLAGRFAELIDRLALATSALSGEHTAERFAEILLQSVESLATVPESESWQLDQARRTVRDTLGAGTVHPTGNVAGVAGTAAAGASDAAVSVSGVGAAGAGASAVLSLPEVTDLLADAVRGRPTRANFRTGELTVCSMVPMRSVPHRVVCLLGLDDGEFPRTGRIDGDDVLAANPVVGERDRTSEDRQLLLDAINAAGDHVILMYSGADERTGARRPPAAALGEILDVLDAMATTAAGEPARRQLVVRHPLQPFDPRNFTDGGLLSGRTFSFDRAALGGALAAMAASRTARPDDGAQAVGGRLGDLLADRLPVVDVEPVVELDQLLRFYDHPAREFLRARLGLFTFRADDDVPDELQIELDKLQEWAIGERLLALRLAGASVETVRQAEFRRGTLPPGAIGGRVLNRLLADTEPIVAGASGWMRGEGEQVWTEAELPSGRTLVGSVGPLRSRTLTRVTFSRLSARHRVRAWIQSLALSASGLGAATVAVTVGRGRGRGTTQVSRLRRIAQSAALELLDDLLAIRDVGLAIPLPLTPKLAHEYLTSRDRFRCDPTAALIQLNEKIWRDGNYPGEGADAAHRFIWGAGSDLRTIVAALGDTDHHEGNRLGEWSRAIYDPLVAAEEIQ